MLNVTATERPETWLEAAEARFGTANAPLADRTAALLDSIAPDPAAHARLLNTLSLLEHNGSYRIMATQHRLGMDESTLRHVAEEAQHAWFMKRQAEKTGQRDLDYVDADLLAAPSARMFFPRLEAAIVSELGRDADPRAAYLYMSMIIEFRALWFYRIYETVLTRHGLPISLKRILGEEQNHLAEMAFQLEAASELDDRRVAAFVGAEQSLYARMLGAIESAIESAIAA